MKFLLFESKDSTVRYINIKMDIANWFGHYQWFDIRENRRGNHE